MMRMAPGSLGRGCRSDSNSDGDSDCRAVKRCASEARVLREEVRLGGSCPPCSRAEVLLMPPQSALQTVRDRPIDSAKHWHLKASFVILRAAAGSASPPVEPTASTSCAAAVVVSPMQAFACRCISARSREGAVLLRLQSKRWSCCSVAAA